LRRRDAMPEKVVKDKVLCYVVRNGRLLVFAGSPGGDWPDGTSRFSPVVKAAERLSRVPRYEALRGRCVTVTAGN
jgi:hypothetical protein